MKELYENCRAHGAKLANGIELGTRDRAQDMWPWLKEDPGRIRRRPRPRPEHDVPDLRAVAVRHARQAHDPPREIARHVPAAVPQPWDDRRQEIFNDNRPYNDSATWFVNSTNLYIRETGDVSILAERVKSVRLTNPDKPESSGLVGCGERVHRG